VIATYNAQPGWLNAALGALGVLGGGGLIVVYVGASIERAAARRRARKVGAGRA
jgi:hypothetical protein